MINHVTVPRDQSRDQFCPNFWGELRVYKEARSTLKITSTHFYKKYKTCDTCTFGDLSSPEFLTKEFKSQKRALPNSCTENLNKIHNTTTRDCCLITYEKSNIGTRRKPDGYQNIGPRRKTDTTHTRLSE